MAKPVRNRAQFIDTLKAIRRRPTARRPALLAFLLFDDRHSHRVVREFVRRQLDWLDELASSAGMMIFFFLPGDPRVQVGRRPGVSHGLGAGQSGEIKNPSLDVASQFGLGPIDLPAIVLFTELDLDRPGPHQGVYCPLSIELFDQDQRDAEDELAHLFSLVQRARRKSSTPADLLTSLRSVIDNEKRKAQVAPVLASLRTSLIKLVTFPGRLLEVASIAFGQELGKQAAEGRP